jgi:energy-coupling factor transporter ATP-binding protein EcfA2
MYSKFLKRVLATRGWYCVLGIKEERVRQVFKQTLEEVDEVVQNFVDKNYDVYFGCAKFKEGTRRNAPNAEYFKSFWLDLDCGVEKVQVKPKEAYETQEEALTDLVRFCEETSLPMPTLVNSGYGIHCYWRLDEELEKSEWKPIADRFKAVCREHGLRIDPAVPADAARVLRVPGTFNHKGDEPLAVELLASSARISVADFKSALGEIPAFLPPVPDYIQQGLSPLQQKLMQNRINSFQKILERSFEDNGCPQIVHIATEQADADYNLWRAGLSIARNCADWKVAIHAISADHPNYDFDLTERKADDLVDKPYLCKTFEDIYPDGCEGCKFRGKIKSPIVLGSDIEESTAEVIEHVVQPATEENEEPVVVEYEIPQYPFPFFRGKTGGVYARTEEGEDGEPGAVLVYEHDLYVVKRMHDSDRGELVLARLHLPKDPPKEFTIPLSVMGSKEELRKLIASHGVICSGKGIDSVMGYLLTSAKAQQMQEEAEILRKQMGWVEGEEKFILGEHEISAGGLRRSPASSATSPVAKWLHAEGDLDEWTRIANTYGRKGFEPHAFAFFAAFGAPLMSLTGYKGAFINLINRESGTGKTTILRMINSVWGHPYEVMAKESDTHAFKLHRLGVMNSLPFTADELSNMLPDKVSELLYSISQGKGAGRMQGSVNQERVNETTWSTIGIGSSNSSMVETLSTHKTAASGEVMRLIEYEIKRTDILDKDEAYKLFEESLAKNYGMAGMVYMQWVINNIPYVGDLIRQIQVEIDKKAKFSNQDRYHSAVIACNIAGASIAQFLDLISIDINRVLDWVIGYLVPELKGVVNDQKDSYDDFLGQFMNSNLANTLIIRDAVDPKTSLPHSPVMEPRMELSIRAELDTKLVYVSTKAFKEFCVENRVMYRALLKDLESKGIYKGERKKRLGKGTKLINSSPVNTYVFMYDFEDLIPEAKNANSHS